MGLLDLSLLAIAASAALSIVPPVLAQSELPPGALRVAPDELRWGPGASRDTRSHR